MLKTLRVGMVGHGFMGKVHGHAYRSLGFYYDPPPAQVELVGVATRTEASWQRAVAERGYAFGTTDFRELCARDDIDIIDVCVPNADHVPVFEAAIAHGKHVYMDKPLCCTLDEARTMLALAEQHPELTCQMTFQYRFIPAMLRAKQLVEAGALGDVFSLRVCYLHAGYVDPMRPISWRLDPAQSGRGGALFDLSSHVIDLTQYLLGDIAAVMHLGETFIKERPLANDPGTKMPVEVDDISLLTVRTADGAIGTIESSRLATGVQDEIRFEAHGSKGAIRFNLMQPNFLEFYDQTDAGGDLGGDRGYKQIECVSRYPKPAALPGPKTTIGWERFHVHCMHSFVSSIVEGKPASPSIRDGVKTQAVLEAALVSSDSGGWEDVERF